MGSLLFDATNDRVACANANGDQRTCIWAWIYPTSKKNSRFVTAMTDDFSEAFFLNDSEAGTEPNLRVYCTRATTDLTYQSTTTLPLNEWAFIAYTLDTGASAGNLVKMYTGSLTATVTEVSYQVSPQDGAGAFNSRNGELRIGNRYSTPRNLDPEARIAVLGMISGRASAVTVGELATLQWHPRKVENTTHLMWLGLHTATSAIDYSGNASNGTVTGTTHVAGLPMRPLFGLDVRHPYEVSVSGVDELGAQYTTIGSPVQIHRAGNTRAA
jgi:hypothetical protein